MKQLYILLILIISILFCTSCSVFTTSEKAPSSDTQIATKTPEQIKAEIDTANLEFKSKLEKIQADYIAKRQELEKQRLEKNKSELDISEQERLSKNKIDNSKFEEKRLSQNKVELDWANQAYAVEAKKINQDYTTELDRIEKEYNALISKIDKEYNIKTQKIDADYQNNLLQSSQNDAELSKAEQYMNEQKYSAEKTKISNEYNASLKKADQDKLAQDNFSKAKAIVDKKFQDKAQSISMILKTYDENILSSKTNRDNSKALFKKECTAKYDKLFDRLITEKIIEGSEWEKIIALENKELIQYYSEQDKVYNDYAAEMDKWKNDSISKLLN